MIKTYKVMLIPNNKQRTRFFEFSNASRYAYNWAIEQEKKAYENTKEFVSDGDLRKQFTLFLKETSWLISVSNGVLQHSIQDACNAYVNFFKGNAELPKFKSKRKSKLSFYCKSDRIEFTSTHVKLEKISKSLRCNRKKLNWVRLAEKGRIPVGVKYYNPRVTFDGLNWWISVGVEEEIEQRNPSNEGIGIDLGIKDLAICSDGNKYENINKTKKVRKIQKKLKRVQKSISRSLELNKEGGKFVRTKNFYKKKKKLLRLNHRLMNIRKNHIHQITSEIIKREPNFIVLEDLNVNGMMKNKHLSKAIQEQMFYEVRRQLEYKCEWSSITLIIADRFYPSSKKCCKCGNIKKDLKLSDRIYHCDECGNVIDRDLQASINLKNYAFL